MRENFYQLLGMVFMQGASARIEAFGLTLGSTAFRAKQQQIYSMLRIRGPNT